MEAFIGQSIFIRTNSCSKSPQVELVDSLLYVIKNWVRKFPHPVFY